LSSEVQLLTEPLYNSKVLYIIVIVIH